MLVKGHQDIQLFRMGSDDLVSEVGIFFFLSSIALRILLAYSLSKDKVCLEYNYNMPTLCFVEIGASIHVQTSSNAESWVSLPVYNVLCRRKSSLHFGTEFFLFNQVVGAVLILEVIGR